MTRRLFQAIQVTLLALLQIGCPVPRPAPRAPVRVRPRASAARERFVPPGAYEQFVLAVLAEARGRIGPAVSHYRRALAEDPASPHLRLRLSRLVWILGRRRQALGLVRAARRVAPRNGAVYLAEAQLLAGSQPRRALTLVARSLRLDPGGEEAYLLRAKLHARLGEWARERAAYEALLARCPEQPEALLGLALTRARQGSLDASARLLQQLMEKQPFSGEPRLLLARLQVRRKRLDLAEQVLREGLEATADDPEIATELLRVLLAGGRMAAARQLIRRLAAHRSARYQTVVGSLWLRLGESTRALRAARRALALEPDNPGAISLYARLVYRLQGLGPLRAAVRSISPKSAAYPTSRVVLADALESEGTPEQARTVLQAALAQRPSSGRLGEALALLLARQGRLDRALALLARLDRQARRASDSAASRHLRALVFEEAGQFDRLIRLAHGLVRDHPDDAQALNLLGYSLAERGVDLARARVVLARAVRLAPLSAYVLDSLGWVYYRQGDLEAARRLLQRAGRINPDVVEIWHHLGVVLARLGHWREARQALRRALTLGPPCWLRAELRGRLARGWRAGWPGVRRPRLR